MVAAVPWSRAVVVFFRYRPLLFADVRPRGGRGLRRPTAWTDVLLAVTLAATITATMNVLGVTLIAAVLVIPAVIARLLTDSFGRML